MSYLMIKWQTITGFIKLSQIYLEERFKIVYGNNLTAVKSLKSQYVSICRLLIKKHHTYRPDRMVLPWWWIDPISSKRILAKMCMPLNNIMYLFSSPTTKAIHYQNKKFRSILMLFVTITTANNFIYPEFT